MRSKAIGLNAKKVGGPDFTLCTISNPNRTSSADILWAPGIFGAGIGAADEDDGGDEFALLLLLGGGSDALCGGSRGDGRASSCKCSSFSG